MRQRMTLTMSWPDYSNDDNQPRRAENKGWGVNRGERRFPAKHNRYSKIRRGYWLGRAGVVR